jgi:hypothetical protein
MRLPILAGAVCAFMLSACGGADVPTGSAGSVRLQVSTPGDLAPVRAATVEVRGTVRPSTASVTVRGEKARVSQGTWSAQVSLEPGVNVVDVFASAGRARPALTAVRVRRIVDVQVPDIVGFSAGDARQTLADADLKAELQTEDGGFFDELLGGSPKVCQTSPAAGTHVDPGSTVVAQLARRC